jgi:hypothetical protein
VANKPFNSITRHGIICSRCSSEVQALSNSRCGRANAGKTTLQNVCNATGKPEIFDGKGKIPFFAQHRHYLLINHDQINANAVKPSIDVCTYALWERSWQTPDSYRRGYHDINNEPVFGSNPGFVFHNSCWLEAGGEEEAIYLGARIWEGIERVLPESRQAIVSVRLYLIVRTQNLLSILLRTQRSVKELHLTQASLVDEVRIYPSMKTSKPKSSLRRPRFPLACTARQEHRGPHLLPL